jgi:ABC-2 type transport system permease protein
MQYIKNEWIKMWSQKNAWMMLIIIIALIALVSGINKYYDVDASTKEARQAANEEWLNDYNETLQDPSLPKEDKKFFEEEILKIQYRIDHDLPPIEKVTFSEQMDTSISLSIMMISIFTVVVAAGIVSNEFGTGTIKMLLTRPVARWKILLSKLVTAYLYGLTLLVVSLAFSAIVAVILFGTESAFTVVIENGQAVAQTIENNFLENILYSVASLIVPIIFAFMIGSLFGSSTLAVSLSIFIILMGQTATMILANYDFTKYIWFANDLSQFAPGNSPIIEGLTLSFSIIVNVVYAVVFLVITFLYFMKRDVTA